MIALNDVKDGYWVTARKQSLYDMPTEETATTDDEESVALLGGHENKNEINLLAGSSHLFFFVSFIRDHVTTSDPIRSQSTNLTLLSKSQATRPCRAASSLKNRNKTYSIIWTSKVTFPSLPTLSLLIKKNIPVAHRTRQLESWLLDTLASFRDRHERQLGRIPHLVRGMTMADFGDKYNGDVQAALRGLQKERLAIDVVPLDRNAMKRKWVPASEEDPEARPGSPTKNTDTNHARAAKNRACLLPGSCHSTALTDVSCYPSSFSTIKSSPCTSITSEEAATPRGNQHPLPHPSSQNARFRTSPSPYLSVLEHAV